MGNKNHTIYCTHTHTHTETHTAASRNTNCHSCDLKRPGQWVLQKETRPGISLPITVNWTMLWSSGGQCCRWKVGEGSAAWQGHNGVLRHRLEPLRVHLLTDQSLKTNLKGNSGIFYFFFKSRPCFWHEIRSSTHWEQFGESWRPSEDI